MVKTQFIEAGINSSIAGLRYKHLASGYSNISSATETYFNTTINQTGTFSKLGASIETNTHDAVCDIRIRKNSANGNSIVSIPASTTGLFRDNTNTDSFTSGDYGSFQIDGIAATTGALGNSGSIYAEFDADVLYEKISTYTSSIASATYSPITGIVSATESNVTLTNQSVMTVEKASAYAGSNSQNDVTTIRFRKNSSNSNIIISIPASTTGLFSDNTNTESLAVNDNVNWSITPAGTGNIVLYTLQCDIYPELNIPIHGYKTGSVNPGLARYSQINSWTSYTSTEFKTGFLTSTLKKLTINLSVNILDNSSTFTLNNNSTPTSLSISIPSSTTGVFSSTNDVSVTFDDPLSYKIDTISSSSGNMTVRNIELLYQTQFPQIVRPDADLSDGNWLNSAGNNTDMYSYIDEVTASDSDYIESEASPTNSDCEVTLQNPTDPFSSTGHIVSYRYRKNNTNSPINITVYLVQGTTVIASNTHTGVSDTWTDGSFTLSGAEADSITNYSDLRLRFRAHESSAPSAQIIRPDGDISAGVWTPSVGTTLFETIDEITSSDTDYNITSNNPSNSSFTVSLSNPASTPTLDTGHTLNYRYGATLGARVIEIKVALMQGAVVIHEETHSAVGNGFFDGTFTLTTGEAANITDYTDLRVRVTANTTGGGSPSKGQFAWAELQLPAVGSKGQISWAELKVPTVTAALVNRIFNLRHDVSQFVNREFTVRHDISQFVNRVFNVRHDILDIVNRIFNLRHDISVLVNRPFNLRHDIIAFVNREFNVRHDISQFVNRVFNIRHDVINNVNRIFNLRHDIIQFINRQFNVRHDISQFVNREFTIRHDITNFVNRIFNIRHDISQFVNRSFNIRHDILAFVNRTFNIRHDISEFVNRIFNIRHDVINNVNRVFNIRHDIIAFVNRTFNLRHDLSGRVNRIFNIRHDISEFVNRVFNVRHDILVLVNRVFNVRHDINQFVNRTFNLRHDLAGAVNRIFNIRHDIAGFVNRAFNIRHDISVFVNRDFNVRHDILQFVNNIFNVRHDISQFVNRAFNVRHDISQFINRTFDVRHDIFEFVSRVFSIRHDILQSVNREFNVRHDIRVFVNRIFNLRHDLAGRVTRVFNLRHDIIASAQPKPDETGGAGSFGSYRPKRGVYRIQNDAFNKFTVIISSKRPTADVISTVLGSVYVKPEDVFIKIKYPTIKTSLNVEFGKNIQNFKESIYPVIQKISKFKDNKSTIATTTVTGEYSNIAISGKVVDTSKVPINILKSVKNETKVEANVIRIKDILKALVKSED